MKKSTHYALTIYMCKKCLLQIILHLVEEKHPVRN